MSMPGNEKTGPARIFSSGLELVRWQGVDAVAIAVPPAMQKELVYSALEHGKAVLCEKPLGLDAGEAADLFNTAKDRSAATAVGYQFRYDAGVHAVVEAAGRGLIGQVRHIAVAWLTSGGTRPDRLWSWRDDAKSGGGILNEFCSHVIDYAMLIAGNPITGVWCRCKTLVKTRPCGTGAREVTAPDTCEIWCDFDSGISGHFSVSNVFPAALGHRIEVFGDAGRLEFLHSPPFSPETARLTLHDTSGQQINLPCGATAETDSGDTRIFAFRRLASDFIDSLDGGGSDLLPQFDDALAVRHVIEACRLSATVGERRPVSR